MKLRQRQSAEPDAWKEAEAYGCDIALLEENFRMTPKQRIQAHRSALALVEKLEEAMGRPHDKETVIQLIALKKKAK